MSQESIHSGSTPRNSRNGQFRERLSRIRRDESSSSRAILKSMLLADEHLLHVGKISDGIYWKTFGMFCFTMIFLLVTAIIGLPWQLLLLFGTFLILKTLYMYAMASMSQHYLLLAVTDKRIIIRFGIFNLEVVQMRYSKVESSELASTLFGRWLGYSSVYISGTGGHVLAVPFIENAIEIRDTISEILLRRDDLEAPNVVLSPEPMTGTSL